MKGDDIAERLLRIGIATLEIVAALPSHFAGRHIGGQLVRSSTSAGANYEEARGAESRADFIHKVGVAAKEARETMYWLRLLQRTGYHDGELATLIQEVAEVSAILMASRRTAVARQASP